jgi:dynein intermediate chain 2, axonemal
MSDSPGDAKTSAYAALDNIPEMDSHTVSTERVKTVNRGQSHKEGGWPKEIDPSEPQDTAKWRKRLDKDPQFSSVLKQLVTDVQSVIDQNNAIDMFENYFAGESVDHAMHNLSASTLAVFKDQVLEEDRRLVSKICWHPDPSVARFLASYIRSPLASNNDEEVPRSSFIWDAQNANLPLGELLTSSPLTCAQYLPKNPDIIASGTHSGLLVHYDIRQGWKPAGISNFENSHFCPVSDFAWLQSKTNSECVTSSVDGKVLWWDIRNLAAPTDSCQLAAQEGGRPFGASALEWLQEAGPTKYLVGTEEGIGLALNKKPKKAVELGGWFGSEEKGGHGRHYGPIWTIKRNPQHVKYFMTVGGKKIVFPNFLNFRLDSETVARGAPRAPHSNPIFPVPANLRRMVPNPRRRVLRLPPGRHR